MRNLGKFVAFEKFIAFGLLAAVSTAGRAHAVPLDPTPEAVLDRAIGAMGGPAALEKVRQVRIVWLGVQDAWAMFQGRFPETPTPVRRQETLVLDVPARRGALRTETIQADGSPSLWRTTILANGAYRVNLKTQRTIPDSAASAAAAWEQWMYAVPPLALAELSRHRRELRWVGDASEGGRHFDVLSLDLGSRGAVRVLFDSATGLLDGYSFESEFVEGPTVFEYRFKPYRPLPGLGLFPSGYRRIIGGRLFRDFDVFDARLSSVADDPWLAPMPAGARPVLRIVKQETRAEQIAPDVDVLRNIGGYNVLLASVGGCLTVVDVPASYSADDPLPPNAPPPDFSREVAALAEKTFPGQRICRIVATHHHGDHFGGAVAMARHARGAVLVVAPGVRLQAERAVPGVPVEVIEDVRSFGEGEGTMEIYRITGTLHTDESLFVYFPAYRIGFEADLGDYVLAAKRLLQFAAERRLAIDRVYGVHDSTSWTLAEAEADDPSN